MARIQLSSNDTAITMNRDDRISPVMCGERYTGKNVSTAINVAPNSGMAVVPTADSMAGRLRMPRCMFTNAASYTTIALSTSIPMAIIMAASDIRCRAISVAHMYINVPKIEKTSPLPISMPFFIPMNRSSTPATVITDIIRFSTKPSLASADSCPWSYIVCRLYPSGSVCLASSMYAATRSDISTTLPSATVGMAVTFAYMSYLAKPDVGSVSSHNR